MVVAAMARMNMPVLTTPDTETMHWISETPDNLQAFGLCSKDAETVLRLADGTRLQAAHGFSGSWPGGGGDVGRYCPA